MNACKGPSHFNQQFANQIKEWSGSDNEVRYQENVSNPNTRKRLEKLGWFDTKIYYSYNSEGFRDEEFDQRPAFLALGCSHTQGVGIPEETTWPRQLEKLLNIKVWNLGVGGAALDTCYRFLDYWIHHLNVTAVICAVPPIYRFEVFENGNWSNILHSDPHIRSWMQDYVKNYFTFDQNSNLNRRKNLMAMQNICDVKGVPFYPNLLEGFGDYGGARDLSHSGVSANRILATQIYKQILGVAK